MTDPLDEIYKKSKEASQASRVIKSASIWQVIKCFFGRHTYTQKRTDVNIYDDKRFIFCCGFCPHEKIVAETFRNQELH